MMPFVFFEKSKISFTKSMLLLVSTLPIVLCNRLSETLSSIITVECFVRMCFLKFPVVSPLYNYMLLLHILHLAFSPGISTKNNQMTLFF